MSLHGTKGQNDKERRLDTSPKNEEAFVFTVLKMMIRHYRNPILRKQKAMTATTFSSRIGSIALSSTESSPSCNDDKVDGTAAVTRDDILNEAAYLTRSLYRNCIRSVRVIRYGNEFDDKEFERREKEFQNPSSSGGVISFAPPPNKEDELRSRAEYYHSYAREYFTQESDCLDNDPLLERDIRRYLYYLRKGEKDRKWLLGDMMFSDPYKDTVDQERIKNFEAMSKKYFGAEEEDSSTYEINNEEMEDEDEDPDWFKKVS